MTKPTKSDLLRAELIAVDKLTSGMTVSELSAKYSLSPKAIRTSLSTAEREGFVERAQALIYERLISPALALYEQKILTGDLSAARDILFGMEILGAKKSLPSDVLSIEAYRLIRAKKQEFTDAEVLERHDGGAELHREGLPAPLGGVRSDLQEQPQVAGNGEVRDGSDGEGE